MLVLYTKLIFGVNKFGNLVKLHFGTRTSCIFLLKIDGVDFLISLQSRQVEFDVCDADARPLFRDLQIFVNKISIHSVHVRVLSVFLKK